MKVLLVTGLFAAPIVENVVNQINENDLKVDIKVLNYPIAALMTTRYIAENLKGIKGYDYIIIPGLSTGDATDVEKTTGITTYKGTEDAYDIPILLKALKDGKSFSKVDAADKFLGVGRDDIDNTLYNLEKTGIYAFEVGGVKIPVIPPPFRIFLEEDSSHFRGEEELQELQEIRKNIDVIVVGFPSGHEDVDEVKRYIKLFLDLGFPVGIDSGSPKELIEGIKAGASFVFNLNEINIDKLEVVKRDASFVVAPFSVENKAQITRDLIRKAKEKGFEKLIADVILSPPLMGITQSIIDYYDVKKAFPEIPMLMGFLNVTELIDADSVGINAILTAIAAELGISCILTMEKNKTKNSTWEIRRASEMMSIALTKRKFPKDLGIDLLILKDKKYEEEKVRYEGDFIEVYSPVPLKPDSSGFARIFKEKSKIGVVWHGRRKLTVIGKDGLSIGRTLIREVKEISPEHALYLGYELSKAEIASLLGKTYIQDRALFRRIANEGGST